MRKLLALLMALFLVMPLLLAAQAVVSASSFILDPDITGGEFDSDQIYESILSEAVIWGLLRAQLDLPPGTDTSRLKAVLTDAIQRSDLKQQVGGLVEGLFAYARGESDQFEPLLDITSVKNVLATEKQHEFLAELVAVLPVCQPGQTPGLGGEGQSPCKPEGIPDDMLIESFLKPAFPLVMASVPNQIAISTEWMDWQQEEGWRRLVPGRALPASLILASVVLGFVAASFWYITALLADDAWGARLQWLGGMLMLPSGLLFLAGLLIGSGITAALVDFGMERANLPFGTFGALLRAVISGSVPRAAGAFMMVGGISAAMALGLFLWGFIYPRQRGQ